MKSGLWWKAILGLIGIFVVIWFVKFVTTPPPGTRMEDQGREHVSEEEVASFSYNSNPPTSGPHFETWVKPGILTLPQPEGQLIHSLEHGYVIIHYNCDTGISDSQNPNSQQISDQDEQGLASDTAEFIEATQSASGMINSQDCQELQKLLEEVAHRKRLYKLIVVPRLGLDTQIAVTAWNYIDKFNNFDAERIEKFIDYHRDHGPEQTME